MEIRKFGYVRVSSKDQNLNRQVVDSKKYVPEEHITVDEQSEKKIDSPRLVKPDNWEKVLSEWRTGNINTKKPWNWLG